MGKVRDFLAFWYNQYLLHTALYMLESWERTIFNSVLVAFIAMASYTTYLFLPRHLAMLMRYYEYLSGAGESGVAMDTSEAVVDTAGTTMDTSGQIPGVTA